MFKNILVIFGTILTILILFAVLGMYWAIDTGFSKVEKRVFGNNSDDQ